jgi:hypothetical protein
VREYNISIFYLINLIARLTNGLFGISIAERRLREMKKQVARCPSCDGPLQVTELTCSACRLRLEGQFERGCRFCALDPEQRRLLDVFLSCRGVIRDMERELGLSYPTVRNRVNGLLVALGYAPTTEEAETEEGRATRRREIVERLAVGELTAEEAAAALRELAGEAKEARR